MKQRNKNQVLVRASKSVVEHWFRHLGKDDREDVRDSRDDGWSLLQQFRHHVLGIFVKGFSDPAMKKWVFFPSEGRFLSKEDAPF